MAIRITSVSRDKSPGTSYHPLYFARKNNDQVIVIPGLGEALSEDFYLSFSERIFKRMNINFIKIFFIIEVWIRLLFTKRRESVFVHSFIYAVPVLFSLRKPVLIIHGTDVFYFGKLIGKLVKSLCKNVYIVGQEEKAKKS